MSFFELINQFREYSSIKVNAKDSYAFGDEWEIFTLIRAGEMIEAEKLDAYLKSVKATYANPSEDDLKPTTVARVILTLGVLGVDASNFEGIDLTELLYNSNGSLPPPAEESADWKPQPLPWWRKLLAVASGAVSLYIFFFFTGVSDLTQLISKDGLTALSKDQLWIYGAFVLAMFIFASSITRRSHRPDYLLQTAKEKRKLSKRTLAATALILLLIPVTLFVGETYLAGRKYLFISLLIMLEMMLPFFMVFESRKPQARELVIIAVLCAIGVAGRAAFFMLPEFKPVWAMTIIAGVAFGGETGFLVGAMTMLASNVLFSQGPWTPWQMFAMGIIGFLAGVLFRKGLLRRSRTSLCIFGALACVIIYGGIMNPASAIMYAQNLTWAAILPYFISGFPVDCVHAAATWIFLWFAAEPMLEKLDRIKVKYGLVE